MDYLRYMWKYTSDIYSRITVERRIDFMINRQQLEKGRTTRQEARLIFREKIIEIRVIE